MDDAALAARLDPSDPRPLVLCARARLQRARRLREKGESGLLDLEEAVRELVTASKLAPRNHQIWFTLGEVRLLLAEATRDPAILDQALEAASRALGLRPRAYDLHVLLARVHLAAERGAEARESLQRAIEIKPSVGPELERLFELARDIEERR
jgi:tetratricopeptide (TPR) repeat protein